MNQPISVIIPTYNVAAYLAQAIQSVLDQTRQPAEIIIVDDCSTENTAVVARSFTDPRIKVLSTSSNRGSGAARNIGIGAATGELVAMLDGDDYWLNDHLEIVAGLLDRHPSAVLSFSPTQAFGSQNWIWPIRIETDRPANAFWDCVPRTIVPHMNAVMRRQAVLDLDGYREELWQSQDYDLFMRLAYGRDFVCSAQVTTHYRRHPGSITIRQPQHAMHCMYRARELFSREQEGKIPREDWQKFNSLCLQLWEEALQACVSRRNWRLMDFHLGESIHVPGAEAVLLRWKFRRAAGTLQRLWDAANRRFVRIAKAGNTGEQKRAA